MMARKPVDELAKNVHPQGRQAIWDAIRTLGADDQSFTVRDVFDALGWQVNFDTIRTYVNALVKAGIVNKVVRKSRYEANQLTLVAKRQPTEAPRVRRDGSQVTQGQVNENLWRAIRTAKEAFDWEELTFYARTEEVNIAPGTTKKYLEQLALAGLVKVVKPSKGGNPCHANKSKYVFVKAKDPGPLPPQIQKKEQLWDPNSKKVLWPWGES